MSRFQTRRGFLKLAALGGGSALLAACAGAPSSSPSSTGSAAPTGNMSLMDQMYEGAKKEGKVVWWVYARFVDVENLLCTIARPPPSTTCDGYPIILQA